MPDIFTSPKTTTHIINKKRLYAGRNTHLLTSDSSTIKPRPLHVFSSLIRQPHGFSFFQQDKDEDIILFTRRHFATNLIWIILTVIALLIPMLLTLFLQSFILPIPPISLSMKIIFILFYYFIIIGFAFYNFIDWFYNIGIITQKRLIDIDYLRLTYIDVAITQLSEIEDVIYTQQGFMASFFDYGDIIAHTVATIKGKEDFIFESVPQPTQIVEIISNLLGDKVD